MKITRLLSSAFALTLSLGILASAATPPPLPLNSPQGLAVDASGNLWVSNTNANYVLKYNSAYVQQTAKTITKGIKTPVNLALDPYGNLWVSNFFGNTITEYSAAGVQNTTGTISTALPGALAFDGIGDLWVNSNETDVQVFGPTATYAAPSKLIRTLSLSGPQVTVTLSAGAFVYSTLTQTFLEPASSTLLGNPLNGGAFGFGAYALAPDNKGNVYVAALDGNLYIVKPGGTAAVVVALPAGGDHWGVAVDNARARVYVADRAHNLILVYSTKGVLLHTIT